MFQKITIYINKIARVSVCLSVCYSAKNFLTTWCRIVKFCMQVHVNTGRHTQLGHYPEFRCIRFGNSFYLKPVDFLGK